MLREQKSSGFRVSCPVVDPLIGCLTDFVITFSVSGDCCVFRGKWITIPGRCGYGFRADVDNNSGGKWMEISIRSGIDIHIPE